MVFLKSRFQILSKRVGIAMASMARFLLSPRRLYWFLRVRLKAPFLPLDLLPSYEHKHLSKIIKHASLFIDVGFNKGQFSSLILLQFPHSKVWAFDPSPQSSLRYAPILSAAFPSRFSFYNFALGDQDCFAPLNQAISFDNNSILRPSQANIARFPRAVMIKDSITVQCRRLQSFESEMPSDNVFLKIDVQGYEMQVLKGAGSTLFKRIRWIYLELSDLSLYEGQSSADEVRYFISSLGYVLAADFNIHYDETSSHILYCDSLYVRI